MQRQVLTEQVLYYGDIDMPKGFEIDQEKLTNDILQSTFNSKEFPFSRTWDMLNTYMRDFIGLDYGINLVNKSTWGNIYKPAETTIPLLNIDPVDLRNSPDFTLLYGVKVKDVNIMIVKGKEKQLRMGQSGKTPSWKKAIVNLKKGEQIKIL